jgi:transmembrane sensor
MRKADGVAEAAMSTGERLPIASSTKEVRALASAWLERRVDATWTDGDQSALEEWLAKSPSHRIAFLRVETAWRRTYRLAALRQPRRKSIRQHAARIGIGSAAMLIALAVIGFAANMLPLQSNEKTYATGVGQHKIIALADGSRIELNTDTVLRAAVSPTRRTIWLDKGEAYFRIVHNSYPFSVVAGDHRIIDLGTEFLVRRGPTAFEVTLVEGLARFEQTSGGTQLQSVLLRPGDVAIAADNTLVVAKKSVKDVSDELGWRKGQLIFDHTALADVAEEFNRYNTQKLVIADPVIARREVLGTFQANNVDAFARVARIAFGYRVENRGSEIVISR